MSEVQPDEVGAYLADVQERIECDSLRHLATHDLPHALAAVEAALAVHHRREVPGRPNLYPHCGTCGEPWPCRNYKLTREAISHALPERASQ